MFSQVVDTVLILSILFAAGGLGDDVQSIGDLIPLMISSYSFKFFFALFDTPLFYIGVAMLKHRIKLSDDPVAEAAV
jgi:uncharacterized PurR-regulated membrane protein YhhQ (DUF165 family)